MSEGKKLSNVELSPEDKSRLRASLERDKLRLAGSVSREKLLRYQAQPGERSISRESAEYRRVLTKL